MGLPFGIQRSTLAGGISGVAAWAIGLGLTAIGFPVPPDVISGAIAVIVPIVVHFVPDAAQVDAKIKEIASIIPTVEHERKDFPGSACQSTTVSNINKG